MGLSFTVAVKAMDEADVLLDLLLVGGLEFRLPNETEFLNLEEGPVDAKAGVPRLS